MVAYTSPDCLPYFECTDDPCLNTGTVCEPSTVWCDLVNLIDPRLDGFDSTIARTATAVPFAKVARTTPQVFQFSSNFDDRIVFDTVLADTDNMVNLEETNDAIRIVTPGVYHFELYMVGSPPPTVGNAFISTIGSPTTGNIADVDTEWRGGVTYNRCATIRPVSSSFSSFFGNVAFGASVGFVGTVGTGVITVTYCELTAYWVAEA